MSQKLDNNIQIDNNNNNFIKEKYYNLNDFYGGNHNLKKRKWLSFYPDIKNGDNVYFDIINYLKNTIKNIKNFNINGKKYGCRI